MIVSESLYPVEAFSFDDSSDGFEFRMEVLFVDVFCQLKIPKTIGLEMFTNEVNFLGLKFQNNLPVLIE